LPSARPFVSILIPQWWQDHGCGGPPPGNPCDANYFINYGGPYYDPDNDVVDND